MNLNWQDEAACNGIDTEVFFPHPYHDPRARNYKEAVLQGVMALQVCNDCPVIKECFAYAMEDSNSVYAGIYGGTMAYERHELARARGEYVASGGAPNIDKAIRRLATKQGIPAPQIGVRPLNDTHDTELDFSA
jgi:WhiB family redox-sensing transcriptional regulator